MKKLLITLIILFIFCSCSGLINMYTVPNQGYTEDSNDIGPILINTYFSYNQFSILPFTFLQPILPSIYENYNIYFSITNSNRIMNNEGGDMISFYIEEFKIVLPSEKEIDLLNNKIDIIMHYNGSEEIIGIPYKKLNNIEPNILNGSKCIFFNGFGNDDGATIIFNAKIPAYNVNRIRLEYTLSVEWENLGTRRIKNILFFNRESHRWYSHSV